MHRLSGLSSPVGTFRRAPVFAIAFLSTLLLAVGAMPPAAVHAQTAVAEPAGQVSKAADKDAKVSKDAKATEKLAK
jgi:hypothetical protein